jgi:hypothetical protein
VTFRDDHDATLARAEALQRELDAAKDKLESNEEEQAKLRAEIARLRNRAHEPVPEKPAPAKPQPRPAQRLSIDEPGSAKMMAVMFGVLFVAMVIVGLTWVVLKKQERGREPASVPAPAPSCTLSTVPTGAELFDSRGIYVGTTPITKRRRTWEAMDDGVYELRLRDHAPTKVVLPTYGEDCDKQIHMLR